LSGQRDLVGRLELAATSRRADPLRPAHDRDSTAASGVLQAALFPRSPDPRQRQRHPLAQSRGQRDGGRGMDAIVRAQPRRLPGGRLTRGNRSSRTSFARRQLSTAAQRPSRHHRVPVARNPSGIGMGGAARYILRTRTHAGRQVRQRHALRRARSSACAVDRTDARIADLRHDKHRRGDSGNRTSIVDRLPSVTPSRSSRTCPGLFAKRSRPKRPKTFRRHASPRMKRSHAMPFGAQLRADGSTRFRLWAPTAQRVELWLERRGERALIETPEIGAGWREVDVTGAQVGELYRYRIDGELFVPDPASRFNPQDVGGPSMVVDPKAFEWTDDDWRGRPWHEAILYELHVGTFTPEGTYEAAQAKLDHLVELGVSAIELMPIADFPGQHNWGYDGVLPFAPEARYGTPEALKSFICAAHARNLMVLLDVVYNHFGPQGNYLHHYAGQFFTERHKTPWGAAI